MKTSKQLLGAVSAIALVAMSSTPALAEGTRAGSTITNTVNVTFNVNGAQQNAQSASNSFTVDQRVNVTVTAINSPTSVSPNQDDRVLAFDVTNLSNSTVDLALASALRAGNAANIDNFRIYRDTNGNRLLDADELLSHHVRGAGGLYSPHEIGVDAREAIPLLSRWLAE